MSNAGRFEIDVWPAYPCWCTIKYPGCGEIKIHHSELSDLKYAVEKAMQEARQKLPTAYKDEV